MAFPTAVPTGTGETPSNGRSKRTIATSSRKLRPLRRSQPGAIETPVTRRAVLPGSKRLKSVSVAPATQWAAVTTRSGATTVPPQPPTPANHGTVDSSTRSPPITACAGAAQTNNAAQVAKRIFMNQQ